MSPNDVDWGPALAVLAVGVGVGAFFMWRVLVASRKAPAKPQAGAQPLALRDLFGKRDALMAQLRELEETAAKRNPEQLAQERYALELQTARVLQQIDKESAAVAPRPEGRRKGRRAEARAAASGAQSSETPPLGAPDSLPAPAAAPASGFRGFLWGVLTAGALGLLLFLVSQSAKERPEGGSLTGDIPSAPEAPSPPRDDRDLETARAAVARNPEDVLARLDLARELLIRQDMMGVFNETQAVLKTSPGNPRALSYQSLVRLAMGQGPRAEAMLKEALAKDPDLSDAYIHLMLVYVRLGRSADANAVLAQAQARFPDRAAAFTRLLGEMRATSAGEADAASAGEDPHAGVGAPGAGSPSGTAKATSPVRTGEIDPPPAPPQTGGKRATAIKPGGMQTAGQANPQQGGSVSGVIELAAGVTAPPGGILFVTLRESGFGAGPPLAAKRIPSPSFPLRFEIGAVDSMSGMPIPDSVLVEARVDQDGDPMTRAPSDPYGREDHVKLGAKAVRLVLKPKS